MNRYELTDKIIKKYSKYVQTLLKFIEDNPTTNNPLSFNLSSSYLNPHQLCLLLESKGFEEIERDDNGWQLDFWIKFKKEGYPKIIQVSGTGITFELKLEEYEDSLEEYYNNQQQIKNNIRKELDKALTVMNEIELANKLT